MQPLPVQLAQPGAVYDRFSGEFELTNMPLLLQFLRR
jgi:hypothetical protein